ncbi:hypothetical protein V1478_004480 [Vespula squamosa]|uniref:Uncharacterized protein n=1 Tax=Vespula squamosa TaxID=30214 RepID=A0ABD2BGB4_VESSQ
MIINGPSAIKRIVNQHVYVDTLDFHLLSFASNNLPEDFFKQAMILNIHHIKQICSIFRFKSNRDVLKTVVKQKKPSNINQL